MFGDKLILGQQQLNVDLKGRIILPKFTCAEPQDTLSFVYSENRDYFKIFLLDKISALLEKMREKQLSTSDIDLMREIQKQMDYIHTSYVGTSTIDNQKRVMIPFAIRQELDIERNVYICGGTELSLPCVKVYKDKNLLKESC